MSRNLFYSGDRTDRGQVAPREGRVSRNFVMISKPGLLTVAPREGRVSRNEKQREFYPGINSRAPRGACE